MKPIAWWSFLSYPGQSWLTVAGQVGHILLGTRALRLAGRRNGYTVTLRTQHQQGSIYVLLLFSCFIMSHSFVTPWTIACHVPLLMNTCTDRDKHTSGKMPQAAVSNQRRSPFLLQCPQGTFYQQHLMSYWQQRKKKKSSIGNESTCIAGEYLKHRRSGLNPWVWKFAWRWKWQSSILAWKMPWTKELHGLQFMGVTESDSS